jgi:hypothetical protein
MVSLAGSPPANTIPIIADRPSFEDIDTEFLCTLSWMHFDAVNRFGYSVSELLNVLVEPAETAGLHVVLSPWELEQWTNRWARMSGLYGVSHDSAYARQGWYGLEVSPAHTCTSDTLLSSKSATAMAAALQGSAAVVSDSLGTHDNVWFYLLFDEAPARQWNRMDQDTVPNTSIPRYFDDYIPDMFTQAMDSVYRADYSPAGNYWLPALEEVDPQGVLSWLKWALEHSGHPRPMAITFSSMHTMTDWAGADNLYPPCNPPSCADQANSVRAFLGTQYQSGSIPVPDPVDNHPAFLCCDAYPFRHVGIEYQNEESYTPALGDSLEQWLLEHYEEAMDSTFIPAREIALERDTIIPVIYWPQGFGRVGGDAMWGYAPDSSRVLDYASYNYRYPTPREFLMNCNIALLRGAKGIQPFCLATYDQEDGSSVLAGHLDRNNIPFDAPYEEWVYRDRPFRDTLQFIAPDLIPPFIDGYDPLADSLPDRPAVVGAKADEARYEWWFEPYGRLWNSMRGTFAQMARVAPELAGLWWWEGYEEEASVGYGGSTMPMLFSEPHIRVFTDSTETDCYLFYVNRHCRSNGTPFEIVYDTSNLPSGIDCGDRVLDHSRRFVMDGVESPRGVFTFLDTLDAGQARLLQLFDVNEGLDADIRITSPDVWTMDSCTDDTTGVLRNTHRETIDIIARFYNMGTESAGDVEVTAFDLTDGVSLGREYLEFDGLATGSGSCRRCDFDDAIFNWDTDTASIGPHIIRLRADRIPSEPDTLDNTVLVTFLLDPADYATKVGEDAWDMTETGFEAWKTDDIGSVMGWTSFTDSISGMFEGEVRSDSSASNRLYLKLDGTTDIDGNIYNQVSLACISLDAACDVIVGWKDTTGGSGSTTLCEDLSAGEWEEIGPVDLSDFWSHKTIEELWLRFEFSGNIHNRPVRIGWVKLTE